jgi:hypothetical protein
MKTLVTLCIFCFLLVAGCSSSGRYWYSEGKTFDEARRDCLSCAGQAEEEALWYIDRERRFERLGAGFEVSDYERSFTDTRFGPGRAEQRAVTFRTCMERKGYRRVRKAELAQEIYKQCGHAAPVGECFAGK